MRIYLFIYLFIYALIHHRRYVSLATDIVRKKLLLLLLILLLLTAIELSLGGSSPDTSTDKTNKNKYT